MTEENAVVEDPTLDNPNPESEVTPQDQETVNALLSELEKAGVDDPQKLAGQLNNAKEYGRVAGMLGDERVRADGLESEMKAMRKEMEKINKTSPYGEYDDNPGAMNIQDVIRGELRTVLNEEKKAQLEAQQRTMRTYGKIQGDPEFANVKDVWDAKTQDPNFIMQVQAGQIDPLEEFNKTKVDFYKGMAVKSYEVIKNLTNGKTPDAPHVEGGERTPQIPRTPSEQDEVVSTLKEKTEKGYIPSEDEELAALSKVLGG